MATRIDAIKEIMKDVTDELVVSNIGVPSKELYQVKDRARNFYMIGSMGLVSSIGLGLALSQEKKVVVIDGDGALLMNLGSLITAGKYQPDNLIWIVINNGAYGSTGNQETYAKNLNLVKLAKDSGFENAYEFEDIDFKEVLNDKKCYFIEYKVDAGNTKAPVIDLSPEEIRDRFMDEI
jgi:sulfopyruvate decarboxylase subunit beta